MGEPGPPKGIGALEVPNRHIYCLDLRDANKHDAFVDEIRRITEECRARHEAKQQANIPPAMVQLGVNFAPEQLLQTAGRRWYPVIDYSRCTNCMECIDFCLFGVYGVNEQERILVENQDNCKKGCPACSRVCPEQAIMFPDYKTPAIAGAPVGAIGNLKIDLTKLFGGADKDALSQAVEERDRELVADGRQAVGAAVGLPKRQENKQQKPKDELDSLMDALDAMEL
jgi:NAD-dependent dihydropyrimidine dehydrogenase PreA subunit